MAEEIFKLQTREDVECFDQFLAEYEISKGSVHVPYIPLTKVYDALQSRSDGGRVFTAFLDIYINIAMLGIDVSVMPKVTNRDRKEGRTPDSSILDDLGHFKERMELHHGNTNFIFRYRALWDKLLGFLVLMYIPEEYERFFSSKSRKKAFNKIAVEKGVFPTNLWKYLERVLNDFDNRYRTPEAHGVGAMRKWSLIVQTADSNPQTGLMGMWNVLVSFMHQLVSIFEKDEESNALT